MSMEFTYNVVFFFSVNPLLHFLFHHYPELLLTSFQKLFLPNQTLHKKEKRLNIIQEKKVQYHYMI